MLSDCCGAAVRFQDICSRCGEHCDGSDDGYDAACDSWELGDEPMTRSQRREQDSWDETCRQNGW